MARTDEDDGGDHARHLRGLNLERNLPIPTYDTDIQSANSYNQPTKTACAKKEKKNSQHRKRRVHSRSIRHNIIDPALRLHISLRFLHIQLQPALA